MSETTLDEVKSSVESLEATYGLRFANQPRVSRNVSVLDEMIDTTAELLATLEQLGSNGDADAVSELKAEVQGARERFERERKEITQAQAQGPAAIEGGILAVRANFVIWKYRRHFAGRSRETRDLAEMAEMLDDLEGIQKEMVALSANYNSVPGLEDDLQVVRQHLELFRREADAIANAQDAGDAEQKAGRLGQLANNQFDLYRIHFAGLARLSRRPELLERIVDSLDYIYGEMRRLAAGGLSADFNTRNQEIVRDRLAAYRQELDEIRTIRMDAELSEVMDSLAIGVNQIMNEYGQSYAGQARTSVNLARLSEMCDLLGELERQMQGLAQVTSNISDNLAVSRDALGMLEREYLAVQEAQSA